MRQEAERAAVAAPREKEKPEKAASAFRTISEVAEALDGGITGGISFGQAKDLEEQCNTSCTQEEIDDMLLLANVSNVSFGVAGAGAILGIVGLAITDWSGGDRVGMRVQVGPGNAQLTIYF